MAYFQLPQKQKKELFSGPETKGSNKLFIIIGLLGLVGLIGSGMSWYNSRKGKIQSINLPELSASVSPSPEVSLEPGETPNPSIEPSPEPSLTQVPVYNNGDSSTVKLIPKPKQKIELNPAILDDVTDTAPKESRAQPIDEFSEVEFDPYINVLEYVTSHSQEEILADFTIPHPELHPEVTFLDMIEKPTLVRGAVVRIEGTVRLYGYSPYPKKVVDRIGVEGFWYGNLFDKNGNQYAFRFLEGGEKFKVLQTDDEALHEAYTITMTGVFLKKIWMPNRRGKQRKTSTYTQMPLIIGRTADEYIPPKVDLLSFEAVSFLFFGALLLVVLAVVLSKEIGSNIRRRKYAATPAKPKKKA